MRATSEDTCGSGGVDITRTINKNVKAGAKMLVNGSTNAVSKTTEMALKAGTDAKKGDIKAKSDLN